MWYDGLSVSVGDYTKASDYNKLVSDVEYVRDLADINHDFDISTGTGYHRSAVGDPMHWRVAESTVWSAGWWQAGDGSWWLLVRAAEVSSFVRADADFYLPTGEIGDVPAS